MSNFEYPAEPPYTGELEPYVNEPRLPEEGSINTETAPTLLFSAAAGIGGLAATYSGLYTAMDGVLEYLHDDANIPDTLIRGGAGGAAFVSGVLIVTAAGASAFERIKQRHQ